MPRNETKQMMDAVAHAVRRREALLGLGAFASSALLIGCGNDGSSGGGSGGSTGAGGSGSSGAPGNGGAPGSGGAPLGSGGAQNQNGGVSSGGASSGGTPSQASGGAGHGGSANGGSTANGTGGSHVSGGTSAGGANSGSAGMTNSAGAGGGGGTLVPPPFDDVATCTASACDGAGQGPFMIHDLEKDDDVSLVRQDIRGRYNMDAAPGVEMQLHLRILDGTSGANCVPLSDVDVYIWHTDGQGFYSGFGKRGTSSEQNPDKAYAGVPARTDLLNTERFCRGLQTTGQSGIVSFRSVFPGWYNGRDIHIHFLALKKGSSAIKDRNTEYSKKSNPDWLFTTQFYFEPDFTAQVHTKYDPYKARTMGSLATAYQGAIKADEGGNSKIRAKASLNGDIVVAQLNLMLDSKVQDNRCTR